MRGLLRYPQTAGVGMFRLFFWYRISLSSKSFQKGLMGYKLGGKLRSSRKNVLQVDESSPELWTSAGAVLDQTWKLVEIHVDTTLMVQTSGNLTS